MKRIKIIKSDITKLAVDAIVNSANHTLVGDDGVDGAIHIAAGQGLKEECALIGHCDTAQTRLTSAHRLPSKYIIHTVGPIYGSESGREAELLSLCYLNCLKLANIHKFRSIAFPSISTGAYGFPVEKAARITYDAMNCFLKDNPETTINEITIVTFESTDFSEGDDYEVYLKVFKKGKI